MRQSAHGTNKGLHLSTAVRSRSSNESFVYPWRPNAKITPRREGRCLSVDDAASKETMVAGMRRLLPTIEQIFFVRFMDDITDLGFCRRHMLSRKNSSGGSLGESQSWQEGRVRPRSHRHHTFPSRESKQEAHRRDVTVVVHATSNIHRQEKTRTHKTAALAQR